MSRLRILVTLTALTASVLGIQSAYAQEAAIGKVISVKQSGWATRSNDTVKKTIKEGDAVYAGDIMDVRQGNYVDISLDEKSENILHVEGPSLIQLNKDGSPSIQLSQGKVYALLDNLGEMRNFAIQTPNAVSSVRGTYFSVATNGTETATALFQGAVRVAGRQANGFVTSSAVVLEAPQKTLVTGFGQKPSEPAQLSQKEFDEINKVLASIGLGKKALNYEDALKRAKAAEADREDSPSDDGASHANNQGGHVLY